MKPFACVGPVVVVTFTLATGAPGRQKTFEVCHQIYREGKFLKKRAKRQLAGTSTVDVRIDDLLRSVHETAATMLLDDVGSAEYP